MYNFLVTISRKFVILCSGIEDIETVDIWSVENAGKNKRIVGSRDYRNYTDETLAEALNDIRSNKISIRKASEKYGIHRNTIWLKLKGKNNRLPGHPTVFSREEEESFASHCILMSNYGFPISSFDLRCIIKSYLDRAGRTVPCFRYNYLALTGKILFLAAIQFSPRDSRKTFQ